MPLPAELPWYRAPVDPSASPYKLAKVIRSPDQDAPPFACTAAFPWHMNSLDNDLFKGAGASNEKLKADVQAMVRQWGGSVLAGSTGCAYVFMRNGSARRVNIPRFSKDKPEPKVVNCVGWAFQPSDPKVPLAILTASRTIFIVNFETMTIITKLKGHGADITSLAVNPAWPQTFVTTSKDMTSRIYSLEYAPRKGPNNPHWPPNHTPSLAGPAFGMHSFEPESDDPNGIGRCIATLAGGRSGGHQAAVLHAAWHPSASVIATCGMDRAVKIWRFPDVDKKKVEQDREHLAREDKPLFSTDLIHQARVLGIAWLSDDVLISYNAPPLMRGQSVHYMYEDPGSIVMWQWLSYSRFLKNGQIQQNMRGSVADYRNSESFKLVSAYSFPKHIKNVHFFAPRHRSHDPFLLFGDGKEIRLFNITHFKPRAPPPFPLDEPEPAQAEEDDVDLDEQLAQLEVTDEEPELPPVTYPRQRPLAKLTEDVPSWVVSAEHAGDVYPDLPNIEGCEMAFGGQMIMGIGNKGTIFQWRLRQEARQVRG